MATARDNLTKEGQIATFSGSQGLNDKKRDRKQWMITARGKMTKRKTDSGYLEQDTKRENERQVTTAIGICFNSALFMSGTKGVLIQEVTQVFFLKDREKDRTMAVSAQVTPPSTLNVTPQYGADNSFSGNILFEMFFLDFKMISS